MAEFLVHMRLTIPPEMARSRLVQLYRQETETCQPLIEAGWFARVWREPGTRNHWALWNVRDADQVHRAYSSFPLYPWMTITVHPLAINPNDPGPQPQISYEELEAMLPPVSLG